MDGVRAGHGLEERVVFKDLDLTSRRPGGGLRGPARFQGNPVPGLSLRQPLQGVRDGRLEYGAQLVQVDGDFTADRLRPGRQLPFLVCHDHSFLNREGECG